MNELQVTVQQTPGVIRWNFEDLKAALKQEMDSYSKLVYTDETIPVAKKDVATLRKLRTLVEDRRKEIKSKCLEPYAVIEAQAKELTALIDSPINLINGQVKDYETAQKEKKKAEIMAYMAEQFKAFLPEIAQKAKFKVYDARWLNATYKEKDWKAAVDACAEEVKKCLSLLANTEEEFREEALRTYGLNLDFSEAVARVQELQAQKERILAAERRRQEEAERRAREEAERRAAAEERARIAAEAKAEEPKPQGNGSIVQESQEDARYTTTAEPIAADKIISPSNIPAAEMPDVISATTYDGTEIAVADAPDDGSILLRLYGTPAEQKKILEYIGFLGVRCDKL